MIDIDDKIENALKVCVKRFPSWAKDLPGRTDNSDRGIVNVPRSDVEDILLLLYSVSAGLPFEDELYTLAGRVLDSALEGAKHD